MKKIFLFVCVIILLFNTQYSFGEEKYGLGIDTQQNQFDNKLEIILFKERTVAIENIAKKLTGADIVTSDSVEYIIFSGKNENNLRLKLKYSFLRLEYSICFK